MASKLLAPLLILLGLSSCLGKHDSTAQKAEISEANPTKTIVNSDTLQVLLSKSTIHWKGTKMRGTRKHEGDIQLQAAYLLTKEGQLDGGAFIVDMQTINVSDIPDHEPVARQNLVDHLKSDDFFDVSHHPTARFEMTEVGKLNNDRLLISGNLTIRGITKNVKFKAYKDQESFSTQFTVDRFQWNIAYEGSWTNKTLIDKEVELTISLKVE